MKNKIIFIVLFCLVHVAMHGQISKKILYNEFTVSVNRTMLKNENTQNRIGFVVYKKTFN